ncbi:hypothetical protein FALCPG4_018720 [Fusarium falciforme]
MASNEGTDPGAAFDFKLYRYTPSLPAAIASVAVFAVLTIVYTWRLLRTRAFYFSAFTIGGVLDWVTRVFVTGDVIAFSLQAGGGGIQSGGTLGLYKIGEKIIIAGLFCQICIFGFFIITSMLFHRRITLAPTRVAERGDIPWLRYL